MPNWNFCLSRPVVTKSLPCWLSLLKQRQQIGQRQTEKKSKSFSYIMRKVWYHQIWIHNNFVFIVLILDSTCILIWCIYSTLCMFRKSGCSRYIGSRAYSYRYHCVTECMLYLGKYISLPWILLHTAVSESIDLP